MKLSAYIFFFIAILSLNANIVRTVEVFAAPSQYHYTMDTEDESIEFDELSMSLGSAFDLIGRDETTIFRASGILQLAPFMQKLPGERESVGGNSFTGCADIFGMMFFTDNLYVGLDGALDVQTKHSMDFDFISEPHPTGLNTNAHFKTYSKIFVDVGLMGMDELPDEQVSAKDTTLFPDLPDNIHISGGLGLWYYSKWKEDRQLSHPEVRQATDAGLRAKYGRLLVNTRSVNQYMNISYEQALGSKSQELIANTTGIASFVHNIFVLSKLDIRWGQWKKDDELDENWLKIGGTVHGAMYFGNGVLPFLGVTYDTERRIGITAGIRYSVDGKFTSEYLLGEESFDPRFYNRF